MTTINIFDNNFMPYSESSTLGKSPNSFNYVKNQMEFDGITIFTDQCFEKAKQVQSKYKVAWQVESPFHSDRQFYPMINGYEHLFDMILTYNDDLIRTNPDKYKKINFGGTTVLSPNMNLDKKTKQVAIVHSGKTDTSNHYMRNTIIKSSNISAFGRGTNTPFNNIHDVLVPYNFAVVIENINTNNYFSEKITDAIACGCIPIYNGCLNIGDYFNTKAILTFRTIAELNVILKQLSNDFYDSMMIPHAGNLNTVESDYYTNEDWIYNNYLKGRFDG